MTEPSGDAALPGKVSATLSRWAEAVERAVEDPGTNLAILCGGLAFSFVARAVSGLAKPFWFDELFTVILAGLPSMAKVREVLATGADAMPLLYYWVEKQAGRLPLDPHIAFRLPSVAGYALAVVGVYWFVRRALGPTAGLTAALVLALSPFRDYAIEARPYALMVGCIALGAAAWQRVEASRWQPVLLALALGLGVAFHHYTVVALIAFGLAEAVVLVGARRRRWRVWVPLGLATIPFWMGLRLLLEFRRVFGPYYWAKPHWTGITSTYPLSGLPLAYFVPFCLAGALGLARWGWRELGARSEGGEAKAGFVAQLSLAGTLLLFPVILLGVTLATGGGYTLRYNWPFIVGFAMACGGLAVLYLKPRAAVWLAVALALSLFAREAFEIKTMPGRERMVEPVKLLKGLLGAVQRLESGLPVVTGDMLYCLPLYYYGDPEATKRLLTLVDVESSRRYVGNDTVAHAVLGLNRVVPLHLRETKVFLAENPRFYVWSPPVQSRWLLHYLSERGYHLEVAAAVGQDDFVFLAEAPGRRSSGSTEGVATGSEVAGRR